MSERMVMLDKIADMVSAHVADDNANPDVTALAVLSAFEEQGWATPTRLNELLRANNAEVERRRVAEAELLSHIKLTVDNGIITPETILGEIT